ncbi:MAG: DNA polymerase/3'-5' exonuclease PolX [Candidatus Micrarchaeota archaeon]
MTAPRNEEIARVLFAIAEFLEMQGIPFKPKAYEKAGRTVEGLPEEASAIYLKGGRKALLELPGIGENIAKKIEELIQTGKLAYYEDLKKGSKIDIEGLMAVPGLGPKRIMLLKEKLGIRDVEGLKKAALSHRIREIPGLGATVEENILKGIELVKGGEKRFILGYIEPLAMEIRGRIAGLKSVKKVEIAGSFRRRKETVGDLDFLIISDKPDEVMDFVVSMPEVKDVIAKGKTRSAVRLKDGLQIDFRVLADDEFGSALQYFSGSKEHNVVLRRMANAKGLTLSEYGLFTIKGKKWVAGKTEGDIYSKLGLRYIEPELRENSGEIEAAQKGKLPDLVDVADVLGDLQTQTSWSDGNHSIEEMAKAAIGLGYDFLAITDHGGSALPVAHALDEKRLLEQGKEIDRLNDKLDIRILKGTEVDITKDGKLALSKKALENLDFVLAAVHSGFKSSGKEMTKRITDAIESYPIHSFAHPTGRVINKREPYALDLEALFDCCKKTGTFLEIDGHPERMDLNDIHARAAKEAGCRFTLSTDAHDKSHLSYMRYAVAIARRGWLEAKDILNTYPIDRIEKELAKRK